MKTKTISSSIDKGRQDIIAQQVLAIDEHKVRMTIRSDSYDFQSTARAEIWSPVELKWNQVHSIHYASMKTPSGLVYKPTGTHPAHFERDFAALLAAAKAILA